MTDPARVRRHAERVRELVASVVRTQIKDPRLGMITITDARITADLRDATVFYTVLGGTAAQSGTPAAPGGPSAEPGGPAALRATPASPADAEFLLVCPLTRAGAARGSMRGCGLARPGWGLPAGATFPPRYELPPPFDQLPGLELL